MGKEMKYGRSICSHSCPPFRLGTKKLLPLTKHPYAPSLEEQKVDSRYACEDFSKKKVEGVVTYISALYFLP
jgi:hypothetical protein